MRLSKDLVGKPIYTISDGRLIGDAKDLYLSNDLSAMAGIYLRREGLVRRKSVLIPLDSVVVFGIDAILIKGEEAVTDSKALPVSAEWTRLNDLVGRGVDTPGGTKVGVVGDVVLDEDGSVLSFVLSRVYVEGPIAEKRLIHRSAIIDHGQADGVMTVDIARAEAADGAKEPPQDPVAALPEMPPDVAPPSTELEETADSAEKADDSDLGLADDPFLPVEQAMDSAEEPPSEDTTT